MANLLFEIGTEELPPGAINGLCTQIKEIILKDLLSNGIEVKDSDTQTFYTPRRIAVIIKNLPEQLETKQTEIKGPPKDKAYDQSGNPNQSAIGFAKKYNLGPNNLTTKAINGVEYVFLKATIGGQKTKDILTKVLPNSIRQTTGDKFMSWGNYDEKFSRPIRWILAILDDKVIDFSFAGITADKYSYGHRFISDKKIEIKKSTDYEKKLEENYVIVCSKKRKEKVEQLINEKAKSIGIPSVRENHLDEVTNITEYPCAMTCSFDKEFLELPSIVIETVLVKHQRYFAIYNPNKKDEILNQFIVITNGTETINKSLDAVKAGNEKVVRARLNDAKFFYEEDLKRPFTYEERINDLSKVTFQKGLGTYKEKIERVIKLSEKIHENLNNKNIPKDELINAAKLSKLDLTTHMVFEMPELQGEIGSIYAKVNNFKSEVCLAIREHYSQVPNSIISSIISIADKIDNICCLFAIGKTPTGSADPFALRKQGQSIIDTIINNKLNINLITLLDEYKTRISNSNVREKLSKTDVEFEEIKDLLGARFIFHLSNNNFELDTINAVHSLKPDTSLSNINEAYEKVKILDEEKNKKQFKLFLTAAKRLVRIVEAKANGNLDLKSLKTDYEIQLLKHFEELDKINPKPYNEFLNKLTTLTSPINTFFDKVLVNDPDPKVKQTRQALLKKGKDLFEKICDFNQIVERS